MFVRWLTKPDDLVRQDLAAFEAVRIDGVRCELDEFAFFDPAPAVRSQHEPLTKEY
ncbi:hypothetical protein ACIQVK_18870 [Streptomyces sp. NPDC090493]|uniref:hypothetical protein n=1 Tax=Streptomyces sp. NPDC090493 TaxID=3365964 RepID=UPI0037FB9A51